jgi:serine/threonine-protein kinase
MSRVAAALQYAHDRGVVHGDIKPANIVFDADTGSVKIIDFAQSCLDSELKAGTAAYNAPERLCGAPASSSSDQFSFAVTLYQLICGTLPFSGKTGPETVWRVVHESHRDVRAHDDALPASLAVLLNKALSKRPQSRYLTMRAVQNAIFGAEADISRSALYRPQICLAGQ